MLGLEMACFGSAKYTHSRFLACIATGGTYANILNSFSDSNLSLLAHWTCAGADVPIGYVFPGGGVWRVGTTEAATTAQAAATNDKARELRETEAGNVTNVQDPTRLRGEPVFKRWLVRQGEAVFKRELARHQGEAV